MTANYLECIGLYMTSGINCTQAEETMIRSVLGVHVSEIVAVFYHNGLFETQKRLI